MSETLASNPQEITTGPFAEALESIKPDLEEAYRVAKMEITPTVVFEMADELANVLAPSGDVPWTIGRVFNSILRRSNYGGDLLSINSNFGGNVLVEFRPHDDTPVPVSVNLVAHADEIMAKPLMARGDNEVVVKPLCNWGLEGDEVLPAKAVRYEEGYDEQGGVVERFETVAEGVLKNSDGKVVFVSPDAGKVLKRDRIIHNLEPRLELLDDGDTVRGGVDNSAGVAVSLLALLTVASLFRSDPERFQYINCSLTATDLEEGISDPGVFARGMRAAGTRMQMDSMYRDAFHLIVDGHEVEDREEIPREALIASIVSSGKGVWMDSRTEYRFELLLSFLNEMGIQLSWDLEEGIYVPRSDDWGLQAAGVMDKKIIAIGYGTQEMHFGDGKPAATSLTALVHTAHTLVVMPVALSKFRQIGVWG